MNFSVKERAADLKKTKRFNRNNCKNHSFRSSPTVSINKPNYYHWIIFEEFSEFMLLIVGVQ